MFSANETIKSAMMPKTANSRYGLGKRFMIDNSRDSSKKLAIGTA
jgi:hypothetical protein